LHTVGIDPFYNLPIGVGAAPFVGLTNFLDVSTTFQGTSSSDIIYGHTNPDNINGGAGNDNLYGGLGDDILNGGGNLGGVGNKDVLYGDEGNDQFVMSGNFGRVEINDSDGVGFITIDGVTLSGTAKFTPTYTLDAAWHMQGYHFTRNSASGTVTLQKILSGLPGTSSLKLDTANSVSFSDALFQNISATSGFGIVFESTTSGSNIQGTAGNDSLSGSAYGDTVAGFAGNDTLRGVGGDDTMIGGTGSDSLLGGFGNDKYVYGKLDGSDIISESGTASDTADSLSISGYTLAATIFTRVGNTSDLAIGFTGSSTDSIVLKFGLEGNYSVESFVFASGGTKTIATIRADVLAAQTTAGNDNTPAFRACA
jgi:hypothetical protein